MKFCITRPHPTKANRVTNEWLKGETTMADAPSEAAALLADPKDTIASVKVWDDRHGQFVPVTFAKGWSLDGTHKLREGEEL